MKKTVIIAILLIYLGSLVIVNFFGLKMKNFEGTKYVEEINCSVVHRGQEGMEIKEIADPMTPETTWCIFDFIEDPFGYKEEDLESNPNVVQLDYHVYPETADNTRVKLEYDHETTEGVCVVNENNMTIVFLKPMGITINIVAADGSNVSKSLFIYPRIPKTKK
jgi:hypothetical protein